MSPLKDVVSSDTDDVLRYDGSTGAFINAVVPAGLGGLNDGKGIVRLLAPRRGCRS